MAKFTKVACIVACSLVVFGWIIFLAMSDRSAMTPWTPHVFLVFGIFALGAYLARVKERMPDVALFPGSLVDTLLILFAVGGVDVGLHILVSFAY